MTPFGRSLLALIDHRIKHALVTQALGGKASVEKHPELAERYLPPHPEALLLDIERQLLHEIEREAGRAARQAIPARLRGLR